MHIEHCVFLSWFSASPESHEQDGETLSHVIPVREATASGDPAMAFRTLPCRKRRSLSALAKLPAAPIAAGLKSGRVKRFRCTKRVGRICPARNKSSADAEFFNQALVARFVSATQVIEQLTALAHHLEQSTTGMIVLDVGFEMLGQVVDPF